MKLPYLLLSASSLRLLRHALAFSGMDMVPWQTAGRCRCAGLGFIPAPYHSPLLLIYLIVPFGPGAPFEQTRAGLAFVFFLVMVQMRSFRFSRFGTHLFRSSAFD